MAKLEHFGLTVSDLEASVAFYRDVVGMREVLRTETGGGWFDRLTDNAGAKLRVVHMALDGCTLQLVVYVAGGGAPLRLAHRHPGNPHLCIADDDVAGRHRSIVAEGRHPTSPLVDVGNTGLRSFYVCDPDGVLVEFLGPA